MKASKLLAFAVIGTAAISFQNAYAQAPYFEGKTITIVVGSGSGGTMDTNARQIGLNIGKHIPGNPEVIIQNMPGGAGLLATNYVYEVAAPDGLTLYYGAFQPMAHLLELEELRADYNAFELVGAMSEIRSVVMRTDTAPGVETPADIVNTQGFFVGGTSSSGSQEILNRLSLDLLEVDYTMVSGYGSGSETRAALLRDEIQFLNNSYASLVRTFGEGIEAGEFIPVYYFCYIDDDGNVVRQDYITDTPCFVDLYQELKGELPSGITWDTLNFYSSLVSNMIHLFVAPPGTPEDVVATLSDAFYEAMEEPAVIDFYTSQTGAGPEISSLETARAVLGSLETVDPEVVQTLNSYYQE